ncbi:MAG: sporulation transcriptional regulator SpoIIID [Clostridia bacterium]|nr:sporulation transcriptional regulator SpoIIID [Clostridia bacterium]MBQ7048473.1 sporulation transcriptional regulator SpoIIID [Clostridia bacterium]
MFGRRLSIDRRVVLFAEFMLEHKATVRQTAKFFGYSKSTVHKDLTVRLKEIDRALYKEIELLLSENLSERHIRGGNATKLKYIGLKNALQGEITDDKGQQ